MEKHEENLLDYEPAEEEANESPSGAEETELRFGDLNLEEEEVTSVKLGTAANPETSGTGGACALPVTPTTTPQEMEDMDPKLCTMVSELVKSQVRQALEDSDTRLSAAERQILDLREEQQKDQTKLLNYEAREARRKEKRKERKERSRTQETGPVPEKRTRTSLPGTRMQEMTDNRAQALLMKEAQEWQARRNWARRMDGLTPATPATGVNTDGTLWYNWRKSQKSNRMAHINSSHASSVLQFIGVEKNIIRDMPVESRDESYCILSVMMKLCGLIYLPPNLHQAYHNDAHTMDANNYQTHYRVKSDKTKFCHNINTTFSKNFVFNKHSVYN